jgi:hypothetical protein
MRPAIVLTFAAALAAQAPDRLPQRLLFVGEAKHAERAREFTDFLTPHFAKVTATTHEAFAPAMTEERRRRAASTGIRPGVDRANSPLGAFRVLAHSARAARQRRPSTRRLRGTCSAASV